MKVHPFTISAIKKSSFLVQEEDKEDFYPYLHRHEEVQICWIKKGEGTLIVQAEFFPFTEGDVFLIASNAAHLFKKESQGSVKTKSLFFNIDPQRNLLMALPEMISIVKHFKNLAPCHQLSEKERSILKILEPDLHAVSLSHFIRLLYYLEESTSSLAYSHPHYSDTSGDRMKLVIDYTIRNYQDKIDLKKMASLIHYTPEAFCRFFKKRTGRTFIEYLSDLRINEACRMITTQEISSVSKVAFDCGFNNVSHFNRVFKKLKKCSPLQFGKNYRVKERIRV